MTKIDRLKAFLQSGSTATSKQITGMFGIANPTAAVHSLRSQGVCVYANKTTLRDGTETTKYRIGSPSAKIVQAAHAAGAFDN